MRTGISKTDTKSHLLIRKEILFFEFLANSNKYRLFAIFLGIHLFLSYLFSLLSQNISNTSITNNFIKFDSRFEEIIMVLLIAPFFETILLQFIPIVILRNFFKHLFFPVVISALLFASGHLYNLWYFFNAFLAGLIFAVAYCVAKKKDINPLVYVFMLHFGYNLFALIFNHL